MRLLSAPLFCWLVIFDFFASALLLFLVASLTDAADGYIAKRFNQETELGRYLDPIADKTLLVVAFITLTISQLLPLWLTLIVVTRDMSLIGGAIISKMVTGTLKIKPLIISKINTAFQFVLIILVLLDKSFPYFEQLIRYHIWATALFTILSFLTYIFQWSSPIKWVEED